MTTVRTQEHRVETMPPDAEIQQMVLDELSLGGWRLIAVDQGRAYLVREYAAETVRMPVTASA